MSTILVIGYPVSGIADPVATNLFAAMADTVFPEQA
jgi:hypothetical protein